MTRAPRHLSCDDHSSRGGLRATAIDHPNGQLLERVFGGGELGAVLADCHPLGAFGRYSSLLRGDLLTTR